MTSCMWKLLDVLHVICAQTTWAYVLETVRGAVRSISNTHISKQVALSHTKLQQIVFISHCRNLHLSTSVWTPWRKKAWCTIMCTHWQHGMRMSMIQSEAYQQHLITLHLCTHKLLLWYYHQGKGTVISAPICTYFFVLACFKENKFLEFERKKIFHVNTSIMQFESSFHTSGKILCHCHVTKMHCIFFLTYPQYFWILVA